MVIAEFAKILQVYPLSLLSTVHVKSLSKLMQVFIVKTERMKTYRGF